MKFTRDHVGPFTPCEAQQLELTRNLLADGIVTKADWVSTGATLVFRE